MRAPMTHSPERRRAHERGPARARAVRPAAALLIAAALAVPLVLSTCGHAVRAQQPAARARPLKTGDAVPSLAAAYRGKFLVGAAVTSAIVQGGGSRQFVKYQFNVIVAEN